MKIDAALSSKIWLPHTDHILSKGKICN